MKRSTFIATAVAAAALPVRTIFALPKFFQKIKGFKTNAGEGRLYGYIKLKGINQNILDTKVSGKDTSGALAIFEQTSLSLGKGVPLHLHFFRMRCFTYLMATIFFR